APRAGARARARRGPRAGRGRRGRLRAHRLPRPAARDAGDCAPGVDLRGRRWRGQRALGARPAPPARRARWLRRARDAGPLPDRGPLPHHPARRGRRERASREARGAPQDPGGGAPAGRARAARPPGGGARPAGGVARDRLLVPETIALPAAESAVLAEHAAALAAAGLEGEPFGEGTFLLRTVPRLLAGRDVGALVRAVAGELVEEGASAAAERAT